MLDKTKIETIKAALSTAIVFGALTSDDVKDVLKALQTGNQAIRCYSIDTIAQSLACSSRTIKRYIDSGDLAAFKLKREWRVLDASLDDFIQRFSDQDTARVGKKTNEVKSNNSHS
jgi:excisionase family DNA binding protein